MLDTLNIDKVAVWGISGGGPSSLAFAARHPNKAWCCIAECAVTGNYTFDDEAMYRYFGGMMMNPLMFEIGTPKGDKELVKMFNADGNACDAAE